MKHINSITKFITTIAKTSIYPIIYLVLQVIISFIFVIGYTTYSILKNTENVMSKEMIQNDIMRNFNYLILISVIISFFIYLLIFKYKKINILNYCKFKKMNFISLISSLLIGIGLNITINATMYILIQSETTNKLFDFNKLLDSHADNTQVLFNGSVFSIILVVWILVPIFEEILFRGIVFNKFNEKYNITISIILSAIIFSIIHFNPIQMVYTLIMGILAAYIYLKTNSIWSSILLHIGLNSSNGFTNLLVEKVGTTKLNLSFILLLSIVVIVGCTILINKTNKKDVSYVE